MSHKIIAAVDDMIFISKIRTVTEHLGVRIQFVRSVPAALAAAREEKPSLVIADLHATRCEPLALARELKADDDLCDIPIVGFFSHVETTLQAAAQEAGYNRVMPRSAFSNNLDRVLTGKF